MIKTINCIHFLLLVFFISAGSLFAEAPDQYLGDTVIYYGKGGPAPNVIFILDNSIHMATYSGGLAPYDRNIIYPIDGSGGNCNNSILPDYVYTINSQNNYACQFHIDNLTCDNDQENSPKDEINANGFIWNSLSKTGSNAGRCGGGVSEYFFLGNYVNSLKSKPVVNTWEPETQYKFGDVVNPPDDSLFEYVSINKEPGTSGPIPGPIWVEDIGVIIDDGEVQWERRANYLAIIQSLFSNVAYQMRDDVRLGIMIYGTGNKGAQVWFPVSDLSDIVENDNVTPNPNLTLFNSQVSALGDQALSSGTARPINEALFDAMLYCQGKDNTNDKVANNNKSTNPSPIENWCQQTHAVIITTGSSHEDNMDVKKLVGGGGFITDVAKYAYENDLRPDLDGVQRLHTNVIQLASSLDPQLKLATDINHGNGEYALASSTQDLVEALTIILSNIVREVETSFAAPVVPASPENRTLSGDYIYVGYFKPQSDGPWWGNLKKFGLKTTGGLLQIVDEKGEPATGSDGRFKETASSFWSTEEDGIIVDKGGVGGRLQASDLEARKIWTVNSDGGRIEFSSGLTNLAAILEVDSADDAKDLANYVRGIDAYNEFEGSNRRKWIMGDVLHSRPLVVDYGKDSEGNQKRYIFSGTNGGMLHAFDDSSGDEVWAFIPPSLLPRLKYLVEPGYTYFVDGTPSIYSHADKEGKILKAVLIFGLRRGGGWADPAKDDAPHGAYYAIDVTNPLSPSLLWSIDSSVSGFSQLAQTWSQPQFARVKHESQDKIIAFFGAGYDNVEDFREGNTQSFPQDKSVERGKGIFAIEVATLSGDPAPTVAISSGERTIFKPVDVSGMEFPVAADVLVFDRNRNGYAEYLYFGDTGGNLWRVDLVEPSGNLKLIWAAKKIFSSNPGADGSEGRKIFYRPDAVALGDYNTMVYFGTGDRAHPLSSNPVIDRLYAVRDDFSNNATPTLSEDNLHDVTENVLQQEAETGAVLNAIIDDELAALRLAYGWYIELDQHLGEQVTASASVIGGVAYFTTYTPNDITANADPCEGGDGNLGTARLYAVDAYTGEAVFNYYKNNDSDFSLLDDEGPLSKDNIVINERALRFFETQTVDGVVPSVNVLRRSDRHLEIGAGGMPSGVVPIVNREDVEPGIVGNSCTNRARVFGLILSDSGLHMELINEESCDIEPVYWIQW